MKIEITDREYWRERCRTAIYNIAAARDAADAEYEAEWLKGKRFFFFKRTGKPPVDEFLFDFAYPSFVGGITDSDANELLAAINTQGTGIITCDHHALNRIECWASKV